MITVVALSGCATNANNTAQVPLAESYEYSTQQKMQAAHHWDVLANDVAERLEQHFKNASVLNNTITVVPDNNSPSNLHLQIY